MSKETFKPINSILDNLSHQVSKLSETKVRTVVENILGADQIFLAGAGRSGLIIETFAMRLMHLGLNTHVVGYPVTPAAKKGDLVLIASGSGETSTVAPIARQAKRNEVELSLITSALDSTIAKMADEVLEVKETNHVPGEEKYGKYIQPLGSPFEQSLFIILEGIVSLLMKRLEVSEEEMAKRHTNLE